ncbi:DUF6344 domain-containing protein [Streptomyces sp. SCSIO 30461]|uniref:DUF6344 domain-containing protein n=1 Tax=Streptomyces sp. SCSIO 30461 TaxID=3118085 RepID=UPI0030CF8914
MAAVKVANLWTALICLFAAMLASLGLTGTASAARKRPVSPMPLEPTETEGHRAALRPRRHTEKQTAAPEPAHATADPARLPSQRAGGHSGSRDRSLPPTIKQRIGAEAHGTTPSVRHLAAERYGLSGPALLQGSSPLTGAALANAPA